MWLRLRRAVIFPYCKILILHHSLLPYPMKLGIINSAFGQAGVDTATGLQHIALIGFDCVDIFTEAMTITPAEKQLVLDTCRKNSLPIVSLPVVAAGSIVIHNTLRRV